MSSLFDFDGQPDMYAVMGNPIEHSKSPLIHREFARQTRQHISYEAIQVDDGGLAQAVGNFQGAGGKGVNITVPFKRDAWELADELSIEAERAGAVNTLLFRPDGRRYGHNTDGIGLLRDITMNHDPHQIGGERVLILGAGGAVRGILQPLLSHHPRSVFIANRTPDRAIALAEEFSHQTLDLHGGGFGDIEAHPFDLIINGTAASLQGELPPLPAAAIGPHTWCYDMMYGREPTVFLQWAARCGAARLLDGLGMLVEQAAESFLLWRNVRPDTAPVIRKLRQLER